MNTLCLDLPGFSPPTETNIPQRDLRVAIVADSASARYGGEAILPVHYFRILRSRGVETWMVVHARNREELEELFPEELHRIFFIPDTTVHVWLWRLEKLLPKRLSSFSFGMISRVVTQRSARRIVRELVLREKVNVVHQPIPVSAKECSLLYDLGAPLVMGPLNGDMNFPPAFRRRQSAAENALMRLGRRASQFMHRLAPGKLQAATVLVANERTKAALPTGLQGKVVTLIENSVDLSTWTAADRVKSPADQPPRFVYLGRLVDWKAVDLLLEAFQAVVSDTQATLDIVGDGQLRETLEAQARDCGIAERVRFLGWMKQSECADRLRSATALVLPSLYECGGAVVLEAMASGLAVIASDWGGPADYLDRTCGILVKPDSRAGFIKGLSEAMIALAEDPDLAMGLGASGRKRVESNFDWQCKIDRALEIYAEAAHRARHSLAN